ncbi:hypothetical protein [Propionivibrio dicarboxylicus]|uniref:Bbp19-like phage domain-containing protein n=1 Tax=Propionivibrio dicarboxylicus TaxID=83767 RepID=A0A1G8AQ93_9RHOO|nr:hypothetical protein [Propionivibrio dicarboxylicus]SDH23138.1 hypothetical protein SAMN05660652_01462 [Propionivibrio dicarboxylicus]
MTSEHNPLDLADEERISAEQAEKERQQRETEQNELRWAMSTKQGRRFIYRRLSKAGIWLQSFNTNNAVMAFNEGRRSAGLELLNEIMEACPDRYTEMLAEQQETKERHDNRSADTRNRRSK